ncbi:unnamed protein product [Discosporangium mesarthrocarpum]
MTGSPIDAVPQTGTYRSKSPSRIQRETAEGGNKHTLSEFPSRREFVIARPISARVSRPTSFGSSRPLSARTEPAFHSGGNAAVPGGGGGGAIRNSSAGPRRAMTRVPSGSASLPPTAPINPTTRRLRRPLSFRSVPHNAERYGHLSFAEVEIDNRSDLVLEEPSIPSFFTLAGFVGPFSPPRNDPRKTRRLQRRATARMRFMAVMQAHGLQVRKHHRHRHGWSHRVVKFDLTLPGLTWNSQKWWPASGGQVPLHDILEVERCGRVVWVKCLHLGNIGFEVSLEVDADIFYTAMDSLIDLRCGTPLSVVGAPKVIQSHTSSEQTALGTAHNSTCTQASTVPDTSAGNMGNHNRSTSCMPAFASSASTPFSPAYAVDPTHLSTQAQSKEYGWGSHKRNRSMPAMQQMATTLAAGTPPFPHMPPQAHEQRENTRAAVEWTDVGKGEEGDEGEESGTPPRRGQGLQAGKGVVADSLTRMGVQHDSALTLMPTFNLGELTSVCEHGEGEGEGEGEREVVEDSFEGSEFSVVESNEKDGICSVVSGSSFLSLE